MSTVEAVSVRTTLIEYIRDQYEREDELSTTELIKRCKRHFGSDETFINELAQMAFQLIVPDVAHEVRHHMRAAARNGNGGESSRERLARVFAHVGTDRNKSFLAMRRPDHIFAAENLEQSAKGTLCRAGLHRATAALHTDDSMTTGEILTDYQLETLERHWLECDTPPVPWLGR